METIFVFKRLMKKSFLCGIKIATFCRVQRNNGSRQWSSLVANIPRKRLPEINVSSDGVIQLPLEYSCPMIFGRCCVQLFVPPWTAACQASLSFTVSSSVVPFSSCPQSFPASGNSFPASFLVTLLFTSGGQSIGASVWASVLPVNIQGWPELTLALTGLISLLSKGLSRVFSSTTVWKH